MSRRDDHGPDCLACHDPAEGRKLFAEWLDELAAHIELARRHRRAGEDARQDCYRETVDSPAFHAAQNRMQCELSTANAIAEDIQMARARLARVRAAHPGVFEEASDA